MLFKTDNFQTRCAIKELISISGNFSSPKKMVTPPKKSSMHQSCGQAILRRHHRQAIRSRQWPSWQCRSNLEHQNTGKNWKTISTKQVSKEQKLLEGQLEVAQLKVTQLKVAQLKVMDLACNQSAAGHVL